MLALALIAILALAFPLEAQSLKVDRAILSRSEDGPAIEKGAEFQPGDMAFFSFQIENYRMGLTGKVQLTGNMQVFDRYGTPIVPRDEQVIGTTVSQEDKDWKPKMRLQIQIPS